MSVDVPILKCIMGGRQHTHWLFDAEHYCGEKLQRLPICLHRFDERITLNATEIQNKNTRTTSKRLPLSSVGHK